MARTKLTSGGSTDDSTTFTTESVAAAAKNLVLVFVTSGRAGLLPTAPAIPTVTFGGEAMVQVNTVDAGDRRLTCFQFTTAQAKSGTFVITFDGQQDFCAWSAMAYGGVEVASPVKQSKVTTATNATTLALTLPNSARNACVGAVVVNGAVSVTPGAGLGEIDEVPLTQGLLGRSCTLQTLDAQPLVGTTAWTWSAAGNAMALLVEVSIAPPSTGGDGPLPHPREALIRRFEPILILHADEKFVPVNAKRFVENATLWSTTTPAYEKANWGDPPTGGGDFPRRPVATKLAALANEPGTFLGSVPAGGEQSRNSFLELGGWNNETLVHESTVSATSSNVYADRDAIAVLYETKLQDSRFWYHAEVFDAARLARVANTGAPDLRPIVASVPNATLLCYYLFFPAHQQSVQCEDTRGVELASHAGDWQCIAILLQGDGSTEADRYQPRYFGITGSRPAAGPDGYDAYAFDDDELTAMKVAPWRVGGPGETAMPTTTTSGRRLHPHVYVSKGSHSLYATGGQHNTDPYPASAFPHDCGDSDSVSLLPPEPTRSEADTPGSPERVLEGVGALLLKTIAGAKGGGLLGPLASAAAGFAGFLSGVFELIAASSPPFAAAQPNADTPQPDSAPPTVGTGPSAGGGAAAGTTIKPAGVVMPGGAQTVVNWQVAQGVKVDGRVYDYVVERDQQFWWPNDDGEQGYRGRWGQRVTRDTLPRRSGPTFPNYPHMFMMALADLKGK